jgi:ABC-type transport system involved in Fe-S cluster assembly fused permease/ATPase subunit
MRKSYLLLAAIAALIFVFSTYNLFRQQLSTSALPFSLTVKGFEDNNPGEYNALVDKFHQQIQTHNQRADHDQTIYFWLSFAVTGLTAATTLFSSIQAAKKDEIQPAKPRSFAISLAILAFLSTLANFAGTHFNDLKSEEVKKSTDLVTLRNQFFTDYEKATTENKTTVIREYTSKLD